MVAADRSLTWGSIDARSGFSVWSAARIVLPNSGLKAIRNALFIATVCTGLASTSAAQGPAEGYGALYDNTFGGDLHFDPLRQYLPRSDLFMPVPGGVVAIEDESSLGLSVEERQANMHGGLVVGYCLRASCSRVTHIAVMQICNNQVGGKDGSDRLVLGVMKLPIGNAPGRLLSLQGRNYAENFLQFGPFTQDLVEDVATDGSAVQNIIAEGKGPVAPLSDSGIVPAAQQGPETRTLRYGVIGFEESTLRIPRLEVRHLCKQPLS